MEKAENKPMLPLSPFSLPPQLAESMSSYLKSLYDEAIKLQSMIRTGKVMNAWIGMPTLVRVAELDRCKVTLLHHELPC